MRRCGSPLLMPKQLFPAQVLAEELLVWWAEQGRRGIPWKLSPEGVSPAPEQDLDPYGIWIAEVMRCSAA